MTLIGHGLMNDNPSQSQLEIATQLLVFFSFMLAIKCIVDFFHMVKYSLGVDAMVKEREAGDFAVVKDEDKYGGRVKKEMGNDFERVMKKHHVYEEEMAALSDPLNRNRQFEVSASNIGKDNEAGAFAQYGEDAFEVLNREQAARDRQERLAAAASGLPSARAAESVGALSPGTSALLSPVAASAAATAAGAGSPSVGVGDFDYGPGGVALAGGYGGGRPANVRVDAKGKVVLPKSEWDDREDEDWES
jgi:hypothetical protein